MADLANSGADLRTLRILAGDHPDLGARVAVPRVFGPDSIRWFGPGTTGRLHPLVHVEWLHLTSQSTAWLRRFMTSTEAQFTVKRATMVVENWHRPHRDWSGRAGLLPALLRQEARYPISSRGPAIVDLSVRDPLPFTKVAAAALGALVPQPDLPTVISPEVVLDGRPPFWLGARASRTRARHELAQEDFMRAYDVLLTREPSRDERAVEVLEVDDLGVRSVHRGSTVFLDSTISNPIGRKLVDNAQTGVLRTISTDLGDRWRVTRPGCDEPLVEGRFDSLPLETSDRNLLSSVGTLACELDENVHPAAQAVLLLQLSAMGLLLQAARLPEAVEARLSPELCSEILAPPPDPLADSVEWEIRAVRQRRAAFRGHATDFRPETGVLMEHSCLPAVSVLLVTMRDDHIMKAVSAMAAQTYPELEIVLGLHGCHLDSATRAQLSNVGRPVEIVQMPAALTLGEALAEATRRARGQLVMKADDDDIYGSEHVWDLVIAHSFSGATVVGKGSEFVYLERLGTTVRRPLASETYSSVVAGGTMLVSRGALEAVGGWRPIPRAIDRGLLERVRRDGGLIYRTHPFGFIYRRHQQGHTWDPDLEYFLRQSGAQWRGLPPYGEFASKG